MKLEQIFLEISNIQNHLVGVNGLSEYDVKDLKEGLVKLKKTTERLNWEVMQEVEKIKVHNQSLKDEVENWKRIADDNLKNSELELEDLQKEHEELRDKMVELYKTKNDQNKLILQQAKFMLQLQKEHEDYD